MPQPLTAEMFSWRFGYRPGRTGPDELHGLHGTLHAFIVIATPFFVHDHPTCQYAHFITTSALQILNVRILGALSRWRLRAQRNDLFSARIASFLFGRDYSTKLGICRSPCEQPVHPLRDDDDAFKLAPGYVLQNISRVGSYLARATIGST